MYFGKLKFFSSLNNLKFEAINYVYPDKNINTNDKPVDRHNHLWDAIRYIIARLPRDPNELNSYFVQNNLINKPISTFNGDIEEEEIETGTYYGGIRIF